ncbi:MULTISPECIES: BTAD domain-containing putative transcriptional regulator [unclassified Streptomyces]|uniref:Bacterial transcriptional activator domain-containing protein n=1 Tax=Streptomyces sp. NBC_00060 TaxID=2975636 RepID=A0AAU2H820_9ACTN
MSTAQLEDHKRESTGAEGEPARSAHLPGPAGAAGGEPRTGTLGAAAGRRLTMAHQLLGEPARALEVHRRTELTGAATPDEITALAWAAAAYCAHGELRQAQASVRRAVRGLTHCGDPGAQAVAHAVAAVVAACDGRGAVAEHHRELAGEAACEAGDPALVLLVRTCAAQERIEQGEARRVLAGLDTALTALGPDGDRAETPELLLAAGCLRGSAHLAVGELDYAAAEFGRALAGYQRLGEATGHAALGARALLGLGDVHRERGALGPARAAYQEAVVRSEQCGDRQVLAAALTGLALARGAEEPCAAALLARRAVGQCAGRTRIRALVAAGWVALADERPEIAAEAARQAAGEPGAQACRPVFAELLELEAMCTREPRVRERLLEDAQAMWTAARRPVAVARVAAARALLSGAGGPDLREAVGALRQLGVRERAADAAGLLNRATAPLRPSAAVRVLGGFQVLRDGNPVGPEEWQSKKARDLLKLLVARRGLATPREVVVEALWPEEDPARCANRLSVALSILRMVLDPERRLAQDHFIAADKHVIGIARLRVDVRDFLAAARHALALADRSGGHAYAALADAEGLYRGDVLEDEPYAEWAVALREEAQAVHSELLARLATAAAERGDHHAEVHFRLRLLERDPYDEETHLALIALLAAAGRHGEARRRHVLYVGRMEEIDVEPSPFPRPDRRARGPARPAQRGRD